MPVTLADLRLQVRERADMESTEFVTDAELNRYINLSWKELYDVLVSAYEDYFTLPPVAFTVADGETSTDLPTDFYKLRGIDFQISGNQYYFVEKFQFNRRNRRNKSLVSLLSTSLDRMYRVVGDKIYLTPEDAAPGNYRIWYIPQPSDLTVDTDELPQLAVGSGWEEYIIVDAAIKALTKEESDVTVLLQEKAVLLERILSASKNRDAGSPERINDVNINRNIIFPEEF